MRLWEALDLADRDPVDQRWASATRHQRVYVAVLDADGRLVLETRHERGGYRLARRLERAPAGLVWLPVRQP